MAAGGAGLAMTFGPAGNLLAKGVEGKLSRYFKYKLNEKYPGFTYFSVDSLGKKKLGLSPLDLKGGPRPKKEFTSKRSRGITRHYLNGSSTPAWEFAETPKGFMLRSYYVKGNLPWVIRFDQTKNHATMLGIIPEKDKVNLPGVLHMPDMGSFRVRSEQVKVIGYEGRRFTADQAHARKYVQLSFPAATRDKKMVKYDFEIAAIYPAVPGIENDPRFDGYRRNYLNTFQVNPNVGVLANNSTSDSCAFVQYGYSEVATKAPELVDGLRAIDLVKMTVDRYLDGMKGYGMFGYGGDVQVFSITRWGGQNASLDTFPSLLIAACNYYKVTKDKEWLKEKYKGLINWAEEILYRDKDLDGLMEYGYSGNSNSYPGRSDERPSNWWDTIGFGHKDAYSNALAYSALTRFVELVKVMGDKFSEDRYAKQAAKIKEIYYKTFYNPRTGVLAGWKSEDGKLHDYYFTFVNGVAITYDLVTKEQGNGIMDALFAKMKEVGYTNFEKGLPGNLVMVPRKDYTHYDPRWGGNTNDKLKDGWQHYENGGVSGNYVYFTLKALYRLGRKKDAERILFPMLRAYEKGAFQGECENGMTKDWQTWDGECWGYEGFLVDNYWTLLAVAEEYR